MSSLVEELQRDALDSKIYVSDLLRKSLVVATKLNLADFSKWVEWNSTDTVRTMACLTTD